MSGLKKNLKKYLDLADKVKLISEDPQISIKRQCAILGINRSTFYYKPHLPEKEAISREAYIKQRIDFWHTEYCYMGSRKLLIKLRLEDGIEGLGRKLIRRYMREMGIYTVYPKKNLSENFKEHKRFPYLLRKLAIWLPNQVWALDVTYIKMGRGHMYLTAIIDWYSRFIIGWSLSDTLETAPVLECVALAFKEYGLPGIVNSDQGSQFTSDEYIKLLRDNRVRQSMDGKARWVDNVVIERWFRSLKHEDIYTHEYTTPRELRNGITRYVHDYNYCRPHENLEYQYPWDVYDSCFRAR